MQQNVIDASPEIQNEITRGLAALKKNGYRVVAQKDESGGLAIDFQFGASEQKLKFTADEWQRPGTIEKRIIDNLDI
jgi:hypothetical protein